MSDQGSTKEAARLVAHDRLLMRSPACKRRVKRRQRELVKTPPICSKGSQEEGQIVASPVGRPPSNHRRLELFPVPLPQRQEEGARLQGPSTAQLQPVMELTNNDARENSVANNLKISQVKGKGRGRGRVKAQALTVDKAVPVGKGREIIPLPSRNKKRDIEGGGRGRGRGRGKMVEGDSDRAENSEGGRTHRGGKGHGSQKDRNKNSEGPDLRNVGTPLGWFRPEIEVGRSFTPRRLRKGCSMNLVFRMQDERHGLERLVLDDSLEVQHHESTQGTDSEEGTNTSIDCKEAPGSGCDSAERLRDIREGKRPISIAGANSDSLRPRDSLDWYNSCSEGGGCQHMNNDGIGSIASQASQPILVMQVWVPRPALGLSPGVDSANMLLGEVTREFEHVVTGAIMYKVDFGGVIGTHALEKDCCVPVCKGVLPVASTGIEDGNPEVLVQTQDSTFTLELPPYFEDGGDESDEGADWKAEFVDWQGNSDSGNSDWVLSDDGSEPEVVEDTPLDAPDFDFESLGFEHRFAPQHWEDLNTTLRPNRFPFIGPAPGLVRRLSRRLVPACDFVDPYWPVETLNLICEQTNRYARQARYKNPTKSNGGSNWEDLSPRELRCWLGICIYMGLKKLPNNRLYWDRRKFFGCPLVKAAMRRARFESICRNIHLVDNTGLVLDKTHESYDKIAKVRWLLESFVQTCKQLYNCERHVCVDEIMIPHRGRRCEIKQYMPAKPVKYGIKVWCMANSKSRNVSNLQVYTGRKGLTTEKDLGLKVVKALVSDLKGLGHVVVTDRFFTSPRLFDDLLKEGFLATGTVMSNRAGMPPNLAGYSRVVDERGGLIVQMHRSRSMSAIVWFDRIPVYLLSTSVDPIAEGTLCFRWTRWQGRREYHTSPILLEYQEMMRGVDLVDQCRMEYTAQLRSHKWWHRLLLFVLDTSLGNAYVLYKAHAVGMGQRRVMSRIEFHYSVASWWCDPEVQVGHTSACFNRRDHGLHYSAKHEKLRAKCVICGKKQICYCPGCAGAYMCERPCYLKVHTIPKYAAKVFK